MVKKRPRLRTVEKNQAPYPLNDFSSGFAYAIGREIIYLLAYKGKGVLEGSEWEEIFAHCIGAEWKPSNVGLDDVVLGNTAWGAKTVKSNLKDLKSLKKVRLISGRNSPVYSYDEIIDRSVAPDILGEQVLEIWNERVSSIREKYKHLRTVVLVKSHDLAKVIVFELETIRYEPDLFNFVWNKNGNLEGFDKKTNNKKFVWQPHGSQFTIFETVPENSLFLELKKPESLDKEKVLNAIGFDKTWISFTKLS